MCQSPIFPTLGLIDELLDGLFVGLGPSSNRGMLVLAALFGVGTAAAAGWCLTRGIDPLHGPQWAFGILLAAAIGVPVAVFLGVIVAAREPGERGIAALTIIANAAALLTTMAAVVSN